MTQLPSLMSQWWSAWFNEDGSMTDNFAAAICSLNCNGSGGSSTTDSTSSPP